MVIAQNYRSCDLTGQWSQEKQLWGQRDVTEASYARSVVLSLLLDRGIPGIAGALPDRPTHFLKSRVQKIFARADHHWRSSAGRAFLSLVASSLVSRASGFFSSLLLRRLLPPEAIGIWNLVEILKNYLATLTLGVQWSVERRMPTLMARGESESARREMSVIQTWTVIEAIAISALCLSVVTLAGSWLPRLSAESRTGLLYLPAAFLFHKMAAAFPLYLRAQQQFQWVAGSATLSSLLGWLLLAWAFWGGWHGLLLGTVANALIMVLFFFAAARWQPALRWRWCFDWGGMQPHLSYGLRYALLKGTWAIMERVDSVLVGWLMGPAALGTYYLSFQLTNVASEIPWALVSMFYPKFLAAKGRDATGQDASALLMRYVRFSLVYLVPFLIAAGMIGGELLIRFLLPAYRDGIEPLLITMAGLGALTCRFYLMQVLMAEDRVLGLSLVSLMQLAVFGVLYLAFAAWSFAPMRAVALANLLSYGVMLCLLLRPLAALDLDPAMRRMLQRAVLLCLLSGGLFVSLSLTVLLERGASSWIGAATLSAAAMVVAGLSHVILSPVQSTVPAGR